MRVAVFFGSPTKLTNAHKLVSHIAGPMTRPETSIQGKSNPIRQPEYYVRMQTFEMDCDDLSRSLDLVKPMDGEILLNTVQL